MGELRLYAVAADEVRSFLGAPPHLADRLTEIAQRALASAEPVGAGVGSRGGLLGKLGPLFKRDPQAVIIDPNQPTPRDVATLLDGHFVPQDRAVATWRLMEILTQGWSWGSIRLPLDARNLDDLDFALARAGVSSTVGIRHLLGNSLRLPLAPVTGLGVGFQPYQRTMEMAEAYRYALPQVPDADQRELVAGLVTWLDGFPHWADVAPTVGRPAPDLVGFWVS